MLAFSKLYLFFVLSSRLPVKQERKSPELGIENMKKEVTDEKNDTSSEKTEQKECLCLPRVRIYYGTRTHKQIGQVVKEFSRLPYGGIITHTILASREQSCINVAARESRDISAYCKELISAGGMGCRYKDAMKGRFERAQHLRHVLEQTNTVVFDIEDLVDTLSSMAVPICPYFSSTRVLTQDADIIFCPFTYLVDPIIRSSSDVHLKNSVVILDEAHNIEDTCREAASFTFYEKEISDSLGNLRSKENATLKLIEQYSSEVELMDDNEKDAVNASIEGHTLNLERFTALTLLMDDIFKWFRDSASKLLSNARNDSMGKLSKTVNHGYLEVDLRRFHLHPEDPRYRTAEDAYKGILASYKEMEDNRSLENKLSSAALICLEKWFYFIEYFRDEKKRSMYKLNVSSEKVSQYNERGSFLQGEGRRDGQAGPKNVNYSQMTGEESDMWLSSTQGVAGHSPIRSGYRTSLNLWCMSPELAFISAFSECRSIVLASGTLCPVDTLKTELGLKFHSQMEGEQVIPSEQIFASVLPVGPSGHRLCATYRNVNEEDSPFISELALTIRTISQTVPKGILCFFPSYRMLTLVFEYMENSSILRQIQQRKVVVKEPRRSSELPTVMEVYEDAISNPLRHGKHVDGALMFAVFRGKISEGIDFTDDLARVVISVGIPFPNAMDDLVKEKKMYNDEFCKTRGILDGDQWYVSQAYRALNQALGRCLRHKNDWGALVLVDERLTAQASQSGGRVVSSARVSTWIRNQLLVFPQFKVFETALADFVSRMQLKDEENKFDISNIL
ncbi:DNA repair helicase [Oesophagostomum dentatum]|uniref:DNA repair helicase n=1 Tax=Oesophagostomum dentatum TaxID=61180 RepID=A0A0B1TFW4_OESDE|nr:DNA repair helicase [Oesophagostomum dentatum]